MYAKIKDNVVVKYPFTLTDLHKENPYTNFGNINFDIDSVESIYELYSKTENGNEGFSLVKVSVSQKPSYDQFTQKVTYGIPTIIDNEWVDEWSVVELDNNELDHIEFFKNEEIEQINEEIIFALNMKKRDNDNWDLYTKTLQLLLSDKNFPFIDLPPRPI